MKGLRCWEDDIMAMAPWRIYAFASYDDFNNYGDDDDDDNDDDFEGDEV